MLANDTLHRHLNVPYVRDEIKILSQRYADRMEEYPNIATKKKIISRLVYLIVL